VVPVLDRLAAPAPVRVRLPGRGARDTDRGRADRGFARKITYTAAIVFSLLIWATAEGFGGPYTSGSADVGTAVIYALVFAALLSFAYYQGTSRLSVDYYLEQRISWWHWVAEVGRSNHPSAPTTAKPAPSPSPTLQHT